MATLEQLQVATAATIVLKDALMEAVTALDDFLSKTDSLVNDPHFAGTIDVDEFIAVQLPLYTALLAAIEAAADGRGTDQ